MTNKKPNVFPTSNQQSTPKPIQENSNLEGYTGPLDMNKHLKTEGDYETQKIVVAEEIYNSSANATGWAAVDAMRERTEQQIKLRDEMLKKNQEQTNTYQTNMNNVTIKPEPKKYEEPVKPKPLTTQIKSPIAKLNKPVNEYIEQLSQPQFNTAFDVIPLPSEGKIYKGKKSSVRVAYMTTADENILTSPNLLQSGEFLEILINRKLLEPDIRYKDLHSGDRNAIMLWLRATSYGEMYPVTILDENEEAFETEIDLTTLKTIKLGAEPDAEGYFDFILPVSKNKIKFKLLTVGDIEEIEDILQEEIKNEVPVNNANTYRLERQIVEVNGQRDKRYIKEFVDGMRVLDGKKLRDYIDDIESGVDLNIEIGTPGGGSVKTFLPLNVNFFWPKR